MICLFRRSPIRKLFVMGIAATLSSTAAQGSESDGRHSLLDALTVEPGHLDVILPRGLYSETLARGCNARFENLASVVLSLGLTDEKRVLSGGDSPLMRRDFHYNESLLCTEVWRGEPDEGLLLSVSVYGETVTLEYDQLGRLISRTHEDTLTNAEDRVTRYEYPAPGEMIIDGPREDVNDIRHVYFDDEGNVLQFVNAAGHGVAMEYDAQGRLMVWTGPNGDRWEYEYDEQGRVILERAAVGTREETSVELHYDAAGRLNATQNQGEAMVRRQYDEEGRLAGVSDASGARLELRYTWDGMLRDVWASGTDAAPFGPPAQDEPGQQRQNDPLSYQYDLLGRAVSAVSPDGSVTRYKHNGFGEVIAAHDSFGLTRHYAYDASGNRVREYASDGTDIWRAFDTLGRLSREDVQQPGTLPQRFAYRYDDCVNGIGRLCEVRTGVGATRYEYDALGRATAENSELASEERARWQLGIFGSSTRFPGDASTTQDTPPASSSIDYEPSSAPGIFGEYYRDALCFGSGYTSLGTMGLGEAYLAGFRSYTVIREGTIIVDTVRILVNVAICYQIHDYVANFVFVGIPQPGISITTSPTVWYIDRDSNMPKITLTADLSNAGTASGLTFSWTFEASYGAYGGTTTGSTRSGTWKPNWGNDLYGGDVTVTVSTVVNGSRIEDSVDGYAIHGLNPTSKQLKTHMGDPWFFAKLVRAESSCLQFFPSRGGPPRSDGAGYGLTQITHNPSRTIVWNWTKNIEQGKSRLEDFMSTADTFWAEQVKQWRAHNEALGEGGVEVPPPNPPGRRARATFGYNVAGKKSFADGIAMQMYNGNGPTGAHWVAWKDSKWKFNEPKDYVERVLGQLPCP